MKFIIIQKSAFLSTQKIGIAFLLLLGTSFSLWSQISTPDPGSPRKHMLHHSNIGLVAHFNKDSSGDNEDYFFSSGLGHWTDKIQFRIHSNGTISTTSGLHADLGDLYLVADWDNSDSNEDIIFGFDGYQKNKVIEKMRLTDEGLLGLGTNAPKGMLHVTGDTYSKGQIYLFAEEGDGNSGTAYLQARDKSNSSNIGLQLRSQKEGNVVNALKISPDGNIGIGTTNPQVQLDVNGDTTIDGKTNLKGDTEIQGSTSLRGDLTLSNQDRSQELLVSKGFDIRLSNIANSHFAIKNAFGSDAVYIDTRGNIGIGGINTDLSEQLQINGRVKASGFIADASSFPDYVFAKDYELMTLKELKQYTAQHHSLPGMPTEKEVVTNGLNIKKVITISVEKIEELYLHTIKQQELIELQNLKVESQKAEISDLKIILSTQQNLIQRLESRMKNLETQK